MRERGTVINGPDWWFTPLEDHLGVKLTHVQTVEKGRHVSYNRAVVGRTTLDIMNCTTGDVRVSRERNADGEGGLEITCSFGVNIEPQFTADGVVFQEGNHRGITLKVTRGGEIEFSSLDLTSIPIPPSNY